MNDEFLTGVEAEFEASAVSMNDSTVFLDARVALGCLLSSEAWRDLRAREPARTGRAPR